MLQYAIAAGVIYPLQERYICRCQHLCPSMKYLFVISFFLCSLTTLAQDTRIKTLRNNTVAIKGKILPWLAGPSGINYTLGIEYGFGKKHAIGIDAVYNDYTMPHDVYDSATGQYTAGPRAYTVSRGLFLYYRRYGISGNNFFAKPLNWLSGGNGGVPYISGFLRYGKMDLHYDDGYATNTISYDEWHYSAGCLFGAVMGIFDINTGPFYKQKYIRDVQHGLTGGISDVHLITKGFGWRLGVNLFFVAKRNSNHYLAVYDKKINE